MQAEQLRQHYMTKYDSEVADAHQSLQPVLQNIKELKRKVRSPLTSTLIYSRRYTALLCSIIVYLHIYWQMINFYVIKNYIKHKPEFKLEELASKIRISSCVHRQSFRFVSHCSN